MAELQLNMKEVMIELSIISQPLKYLMDQGTGHQRQRERRIM